MKRKNIQNTNGITISDSIIMSVKQKHTSMQKPFAALITIIGMASVVLSFLGMFHFKYDALIVFAAFVFFSIIHIAAALKGGKALWVYAVSVFLLLLAAYKNFQKIVRGFKFVYNIIYKESYESNINFYTELKKVWEYPSVTILFVFYIWLIAIIISYFTICRPNPILPLMVTFPILEIGMYNGVNVPVFWGILCVSYWLAILAMSTIDVGEYSGGQSGFVRKNNLFFPKRHMKLKVTERCGIFIIASVMIVCTISYAFLKITNYERSEALNQKRRDITQAVNDFSFDNIADSIADISIAFGLDFEYDNHQLGKTDFVRYKNVTDLSVTLLHPENSGAVYLRDYVGSVYKDNEWFKLSESEYSAKVFKDFEKYKMYPQDFPAACLKYLNANSAEDTMWIKNSLKKSHKYAPYGTVNYGKTDYIFDTLVSPKDGKKGESSYKYVPTSADDIYFLLGGSLDAASDFIGFADASGATLEIRDQNNNLRVYNSGDSGRSVYSVSEVNDPNWRDAIQKYCEDNDLFTYDDYFTIDNDFPINQRYISNHGEILMAQLLENKYRSFVYDNYLEIPNTNEMEEVRQAYADILDAADTQTIDGRFETLKKIREKISSDSTYSLQPGKTPSTRDFVNYFLLENHKGYCTHYATSGVMLARMAGIPARYATGYIIVEKDIDNAKKNEDGSVTIDVKDNRSHAWAEVYIDGIGWIPYEFTAGYSQTEINTDPTEPTTDTATTTTQGETTTVTTESTSSKTTDPNRTTKAHTSTTFTSTTTTVTTIVSGHGGGKHFHIPHIVKDIFLIILITAFFVGLVLARRYLILKLREKHFSSGSSKTRIKHIYAYSEKLLKELQLSSEYCNYKSFAGEVEKWYGDIFFEKGDFDKLTDTALRTSYGNGTPTDEEIKSGIELVGKLAEKIYQKADIWHKVKLSFISVLR